MKVIVLILSRQSVVHDIHTTISIKVTFIQDILKLLLDILDEMLLSTSCKVIYAAGSNNQLRHGMLPGSKG